jgi:hypothetical protein
MALCNIATKIRKKCERRLELLITAQITKRPPPEAVILHGVKDQAMPAHLLTVRYRRDT